jgi:acetyltransferase-like isoleucine patch superfamily enzyme
MLLKLRNLIIRVYRILNTFVWKKVCYIGTHSRVFEGCVISKKGTLYIGNDSLIGKNTSISLMENASVRIGNFVSIGSNSQITANNRIVIGDGVMTGPMVLITDNSHGDFERSHLSMAVKKRPIISKGPVVIMNNVWVGAKASILPNVTIGEGSVIGANAVVTKDVPPFSLVVGNPAKVVKRLME